MFNDYDFVAFLAVCVNRWLHLLKNALRIKP